MPRGARSVTAALCMRRPTGLHQHREITVRIVDNGESINDSGLVHGAGDRRRQPGIARCAFWSRGHSTGYCDCSAEPDELPEQHRRLHRQRQRVSAAVLSMVFRKHVPSTRHPDQLLNAAQHLAGQRRNYSVAASNLTPPPQPPTPLC